MKEAHASAGSGFVHFAKLIPVTVALTHGVKHVALTAAELEEQLGVVGLAAKLAAIVAEGGLGDSKKTSLSPNANADQEILTALAFREEETSRRSERLVAPSTPVDESLESRESFARYLAQTLGDLEFRNAGFYRKVLRTVPRNLVLDALGRAKDAQDVRKSRAHLFAYLIRDHFPKQGTTRSPNV